ncbi:hypothetical protein [Brevibacillus formosus]|uniref:hypothetical protein n=1 Tax=Brevibacillus formosus TaxID=54913 RepID=UPI003F1B0D26
MFIIVLRVTVGDRVDCGHNLIAHLDEGQGKGMITEALHQGITFLIQRMYTDWPFRGVVR